MEHDQRLEPVIGQQRLAFQVPPTERSLRLPTDQLGLRRCRIKQNVTQESRIGSMLQREYDCS